MRQRKLLHSVQFLKARADQQLQSYCMSHADWRSMLSMPWHQAWEMSLGKGNLHTVLCTLAVDPCILCLAQQRCCMCQLARSMALTCVSLHGVICTCMLQSDVLIHACCLGCVVEGMHQAAWALAA